MEKITLNISGMHCASCAGNIEGVLRKVPGVKRAQVNFALEKAQIEFEPEKIGIKDLIGALEKAGYKAKEPEESYDRERQQREKEVKTLKIKFIISIVLAGLLMYVAMGSCVGLRVHTFIMENMALIQFILASGVLSCGYQFFTRGLSVVMRSRRPNMDTLVALGVGSAYLYSLFVSIEIWKGNKSYGPSNLYYEVAAFLIAFILLGRYLEAITKRRTSEAIKRLWNLRPKTAVVIRNEKEEELAVDELVAGDIVVIRPGERIPVDGKVIEGYSSLDESCVTGESLPVEKNIGDMVISGSINKTGSFKFKATRVGKETTLAQVIKLVEEAQMSKAPVQELADRIAAVFVPSVLIIAFASFFIWILLGESFIFGLTVFITVLIIACPCTLGLATPTAVMVGTGLAAENGIIIKNAASLQVAHGIKAVIFDKTGTLTIGKPKVTDIIGYNYNENDILRLAASLEKKSEHPLADAVVSVAYAKGISLIDIQAFVSLPGKGVIGKAADASVFLGNRKLMQEKEVDIQKAGLDLDKLESEGKTVMFLAGNSQLIGLVAVRDTLKEFSQEAINRLKAIGKEVIMLTGDNKRTALAIAKELGIDAVLAEVLPKDKVDEIKSLQDKGLNIAFVGDGINDAPALTQADLGMAIGSGSDVAIEAGDVILIKDDLRDVVMALDLSRYAMKKIKQNLFFSFFYNSLGIPLAAGILYPFTGFLLNPMVAGIAMAFSSVSVVTNSLLMRRYRRPKIKTYLRFSKVFCIFFLFLSAVGQVQADTKVVVLTLDDAIAMALGDNRDILGNQEKLRQAAWEIAEAGSGYLPEITLEGSAVDTRGLYKKDIVSYSFSGGIKQYLYKGGKIGNTLKQAEHKGELQEAILEKTVLDTIAKVKKAFYALSLVKELTRVNSEILRNSQEHLAAVRARYEKGEASESEVLQYELSLAEYESLYHEALNQRENAAQVLKNILYLKDDTGFEILNNLEYTQRQLAIDEAILVALRQRPEIKQYEAQQAVDTKTLAIARADNRPSIYASFDYTSRSTTALTFSPGKGWQDYNTLGFTLSWPIFDGWLTKAKIEQAVSVLKQDAILKDKLIMDIASQVKEAYLALKTAIAKIAASKKDNRVYANNARILEVRYNQGLASELEMKDANLAFLLSEFNHTQALYDCLMAKAQLDSAMGAR